MQVSKKAAGGFFITSRWSMKLMMRISPWHLGQISGSVSTVTKEDDDHQFRTVPADAVAVGALLPGNLRAWARDRPGVGDARLRQRLARRAPLLDLRL